MKKFLRIFITYDFYVTARFCIASLMILLTVYVTRATSLPSHWNFRLSTIILKENYLSDMCTHGRFVTNKYTGVTFWSKCGKCESCRQEKAAARAARIRAEYSKDVQVFFCELDYDRFSCPYFTQADFDKILSDKNNHVFKLPIYRDHIVKWNIKTQSYFHLFKPVLLYNHIIEDNDFQFSSDLQKCQWLNKSPRKIGVPYFKDIQDFEKRFRIWLKRKLNYDKKIKFFNVNECGEKRQRPHFHFLLYAGGLTEAQVREAVIACWPFSNRAKYEKIAVSQGQKPKVVQLVVDDPAGYVASYVNSDSYVSPFLRRYFKVSKHSASKLFGHGLSAFSLEKIQEKVRQGDLLYTVERTRGKSTEYVDLPIPKYVINRYFPLFKGYSRFTDHQVFEFLSSGFDIGYLVREAVRYDSRTNFKINYTCDKHANISSNPDVPRIGVVRGDLTKIRKRLLHSYEFFRSVYPSASYSDYARCFVSAWNCYRSGTYKRFVTDETISDFYKYDNIACYPPDRQIEFHRQLDPGCVFIVDNNQKPHYVNKTNKMTEMYYKYDKQRRVSDSVRSYNDMYS